MKKTLSRLSIINELSMTVLVALSIGMLLFEELRTVTPYELYLIDQTDFFIAIIFLIEFIVAFSRAPERSFYFRNHWWELLAAIPFTSPFTQAMRAVRILRVLRFFRTGTHFTVAEHTQLLQQKTTKDYL